MMTLSLSLSNGDSLLVLGGASFFLILDTVSTVTLRDSMMWVGLAADDEAPELVAVLFDSCDGDLGMACREPFSSFSFLTTCMESETKIKIKNDSSIYMYRSFNNMYF